MSKFLSWLKENHFFEVPRDYNLRVVSNELTAERLNVDFEWRTDGRTYPMNFELKLADPDKLGYELYPWTFFGVLEHTPWYGRALSALLILFYPGFPLSLIFGGWYVISNLLKAVLFSPYYLTMGVYNKYIELREGMTRHSYARLQAFRQAGLNNESVAVLRNAMQQLHRDFGKYGR